MQQQFDGFSRGREPTRRLGLASGITMLMAAAISLFGVTAQADMTTPQLKFNGYFRAGTNTEVGGSSKDAGSCYSLPLPRNDGLFFRLGNECRDYGEFALSANEKVDDVDLKAYFMMDMASDSRSAVATEEWSRRNRQMFVEAGNLLPNGKLWIGRRYYRDFAGFGGLHPLDGFQVQSSGNGAGVSDINIGDNTYYVAVFAYGGEGEVTGRKGTGEANYQNPMLDLRGKFDAGDIGTLSLALQYLWARDAIDEVGMSSGYTISGQWDKTIGSFKQQLGAQLGVGSMSANPGCFGTDGGGVYAYGSGGCFAYEADKNSTGYRIYDTGLLNVSDRFKVLTTLMYSKASDYQEVLSVGFRPHYSLSKHWSVLAELGYNQLQFSPEFHSENTREMHLMQYTAALQATTNSENFWSRPSLRFYVSNFDWNRAASDGGLGVPGENDAHTALVIGAQTEIWF